MSSLRVPVTGRDHSIGPEDAMVTVVEYGDYQCPYCREALSTVNDVLAEFGDQVRFVFRDFPLVDVHPDAVDAATVADFAGDHGRFWEANNALFAHQDELGPALYARICDQLGLPARDLEEALRTNRYGDRISADEEGGLRSGVNGTPTFFVGGVRIDGGAAVLRDAVIDTIGAGAG